MTFDITTMTEYCRGVYMSGF